MITKGGCSTVTTWSRYVEKLLEYRKYGGSTSASYFATFAYTLSGSVGTILVKNLDTIRHVARKRPP